MIKLRNDKVTKELWDLGKWMDTYHALGSLIRGLWFNSEKKK